MGAFRELVASAKMAAAVLRQLTVRNGRLFRSNDGRWVLECNGSGAQWSGRVAYKGAPGGPTVVVDFDAGGSIENVYLWVNLLTGATTWHAEWPATKADADLYDCFEVGKARGTTPESYAHSGYVSGDIYVTLD